MTNIQQPHEPLPRVKEWKENSRKSRKIISAILLVIIGFLLTSQIVSFTIPRTVGSLDIPALNSKLEDIAKGDKKYDFVFLGSSRVFRGVDSVEVDAEARRLGCDIKTYNFGIGGLSLLEQKYVLNKLDELDIKIGTIFIDPYSVPESSLDKFISDRRRYFYTWENLPDLILDQATLPKSVLYRARSLAYFSFGFLREQAGVGRLSNILFPGLAKADDVWDKPIRQGYMPLDEEPGREFDLRRKLFAREKRKFERELEGSVNGLNEIDSSWARSELVLDVTDIIRGMKITPAILFMPNAWFIVSSRHLEDELAKETLGSVPIINLNRPERYSDILKADNMFDGGHLNSRGAVVLAKHLAYELCSLMGTN